MVGGERLGHQVVIIAVVFLLGMADAVHVGVLGHGQPDAVGLLAGQQARHAGAVDGCDHPILIFQDARRQVQMAFGVHHVGLGPIEHDHAVDGAGQGGGVLEMPAVRRIGHGGRVVGDGEGFVAAVFGGSRHLV